MINKKINLLDCTLRDGGYYNNWNFPVKLIEQYLEAMSEIKVDFVEIGFRFLDKIRTKGPNAYTSEKFLKKLKVPKKLKIGVMINAGDFINKSESPENLIDKTFLHSKYSPLSLVRIACHYHEIPKIHGMVQLLKKKNYLVAINIMQISERSSLEIKKILNEIKKMRIKTLYFADSLGSLKPSDIKKIIFTLKKSWNGEIGIHTHDNMGKALDNSLEAVKYGVNWVDSTVLGMGRGPGNTKTETAILEFNKTNKKKIDQVPILNLIDEWFKPLREKYNWGSNNYYYLAGLKGVHPTFVQTMLGDPTFKPDQILNNINHLSKIGGKSYIKELINSNEQLYRGKDIGTWKPSDYLKNKKMLILGPGQNLQKNKKKIIKFINKYKPIVLSVNFKNYIPSRLINYHIACHSLRLLVELKSKNLFTKPIILPLNRLNNLIQDSKKRMKILNFGVQVKKGIFKFEEKGVILPNSLAISYSLALASSGNVEKIYLAGFDGYDRNNPKKLTVDETLENYKKTPGSKKIVSLTSTIYKVKLV